MKTIIFVLSFLSLPVVHAGPYVEIGAAVEFGSKTILPKPTLSCQIDCDEFNDMLFHIAIGYNKRIERLHGNVFFEAEHKSHAFESDHKGGYTGATAGIRWEW